jgi:hypothetical protein
MFELTYLRKLIGDAWIDAEVCAKEPSHRLGLQYKRDKNDPWVRHAEELVKEILTNPRVRFDAHVLADKIKDPYDSTLAEIESAVFLARQGFEIVLEPNAPALVGPDIRADWDGVSYFVEVRAAGFSEDEERRERLTNQIFARLTETPSTYSASLIIGDKYSVDSPRTRAAIAAIIEVLGVLKERQIKKATFHFVYPDGKLLLPSGVAYSLSTQAHEILRNADLVVHFDDLEKEMTGTQASLMKKIKKPPEPVNDHERLKSILQNKRKQLPKSSRGIITLEVTEQFMLSDFSVEAALYGDLLVEFKLVNGPQEAVGGPIARRSNRGFFRKTSRVSAVVIQRRRVEGGRVECERKVYPTNRANADTIRLTLAELQRFGELEDREHLTAEHAPNHVDENVEADNEP